MRDNRRLILVVDDEVRITRVLRECLSAMDYDVICAYDGEQALELFYRNEIEIDLILLDVQMPKMSGIAVLSELRRTSLVPVVYLTTKGEEYEHVKSCRSGVDDYLVKPFSQTALVQCMQSLSSRLGYGGTPPLMVGGLSLDQYRRLVTIDGRAVDLTRREFDLLAYFLLNEGRTLTREQLLNGVWGYDFEGDLRTVDTHVKQLRNKLKDYAPCIKTRFRVGYQFQAPLCQED